MCHRHGHESDLFRALESISPRFVAIESKSTKKQTSPVVVKKQTQQPRVPGKNAIGLFSLTLSDNEEEEDEDNDDINDDDDDYRQTTPLTRSSSVVADEKPIFAVVPTQPEIDVDEISNVHVNLAARELEASKDFPAARAELQLNTHGSFFHSPASRPTWHSIPELLAVPETPMLSSPLAAPAVPQTPRTPFVGLLASAGVAVDDADDDTASLLLSEWRRRTAVASAERVAQASQRATDDQLELRRQSLARQDEALRRAQQSLVKSVSDAAARERSDRQRIDAERAADLAAAESLARDAQRIAAAAQAKIDAAARAEAARLQAEAEAKARAEAAAAAAKLKAEQEAAAAATAAAKLKADQEAAAAAAATTATVATKEKTQQPVVAVVPPTGDTLKMPNGRSCLATPEALELYTRCLKHVDSMLALAAKAEAEPTWPEMKKQYDKHINQKINAITLDRDHAKRLCLSLLSVIAETAKQDKRAHTVYCLVSIAKKLVARAPQLKGTTAEVFPVADVAAQIMAQVAGVRDLLFGFLFLECPYAAPLFPLRDTRENDDEYLEHGLHYRRGLDGALESESDYKLRQIDYIVLFAAICRAGDAERFGDQSLADARAWSVSAAQQKSVGIAWAWVWLARMLNSKPRRISLVLLEAFLQICGHDLALTYPRQFSKMIHYFATQYAPLLPKDQDTDAKSRLQSLLVEQKCAQPPTGANY
jgi:hypothetical protein